MVLRQYNQVGSNFFYHHSRSSIPPEGLTTGPETHRQYELLYLLQGQLTYYIEGRTYTVHPEDMVLIAPNDIHIVQLQPGVDYERIVLHFNLDLLKSAFRDLLPNDAYFQWSRANPVIPGALCRKFQLQEALLSLVNNNEPASYQGLFALSKTVDILIRIDKIFSQRKSALAKPISIDPLVHRIAAYVDTHLSQPIVLDDIAQELLISKSSLCHRFRTAMNMTVNRYIAVKKISLANELIHNGMGAAEAAHTVGYSN